MDGKVRLSTVDSLMGGATGRLVLAVVEVVTIVSTDCACLRIRRGDHPELASTGGLHQDRIHMLPTGINVERYHMPSLHNCSALRKDP